MRIRVRRRQRLSCVALSGIYTSGNAALPTTFWPWRTPSVPNWSSSRRRVAAFLPLLSEMAAFGRTNGVRGFTVPSTSGMSWCPSVRGESTQEGKRCSVLNHDRRLVSSCFDTLRLCLQLVSTHGAYALEDRADQQTQRQSLYHRMMQSNNGVRPAIPAPCGHHLRSILPVPWAQRSKDERQRRQSDVVDTCGTSQ